MSCCNVSAMDISIRHVSRIVLNGNCGVLNGARKIDANLKRHYRMVDPCAKHFDEMLSKHSTTTRLKPH
jgi:hypothetical protein